MNKEEIIERLEGMGIETENAFPKTSFPKNGEICIGLFEREMREDFYFFNNYDKKIYKFPKLKDFSKLDTEDFRGDTKYMVPLYMCEPVWEDKPFIEKPDLPFRDMSLRQYACIHLGVPNSGVDWLDALIKTKGYVGNN